MFPEARILEIDLSNESVSHKTLSPDEYRLYPGGSALAVYLILKYQKPRVDPLAPENTLVFSVSPTTGLPISGNSRMVVAAKSPLTGGIGDSQSGGFFPAAMKANGYDALVISGKAAKPLYIYIDGDQVQLISAEELWGQTTGETEKRIKQQLGSEKLEIAQIGPAGENLVRYACILTMCNRANGRTGMGAVMGSKNLKAVVVQNRGNCKAHDKDNFLNLSREMSARLKNNDAVSGLAVVGTAGDLEEFNNTGFLATRNWQTGYFGDKADSITGNALKDTILIGTDTCYACGVKCKRVVEVRDIVDPIYGGPEYETIAALGSYCGINDLESIALGNQLCNMYGLDTISCGATISFAMECFEKGLINKSDTDGLDLHFGNTDAMLQLVERIAKREGVFAELLGEGSYRAAISIGDNAPDYCMTVKGEELPAHMPQLKPGLGIIYAVNPFGCDHQSSENDPLLMMPEDSQEKVWLGKIGITQQYDTPYDLDVGKARFAFDSQCYYSILDTLCLCQFVWGPTWQLYGPDDIVKLCKYGIGWDTSLFELMRVGERRINLLRVFNAREGFTKKDDTLPKRLFKPFIDGPSKGIGIDEDQFFEAVNNYYEIAGWDPSTGNPRKGTLQKLSLGWLIEDDKK